MKKFARGFKPRAFTLKLPRPWTGHYKRGKDITERIISCAMEVHSAFSPGLLENVYEPSPCTQGLGKQALAHEFELRHIKFKSCKEENRTYH